MTDLLRQVMTEQLQSIETYHAGRRAEMQAEIDRLRTNIVSLGDYAKSQTVEYERKAEAGGMMADYYRGKADTYLEIGMRADITYMKGALEDIGVETT